eukprot:1138961-Pelagomonas_calceolata.AAC.6
MACADVVEGSGAKVNCAAHYLSCHLTCRTRRYRHSSNVVKGVFLGTQTQVRRRWTKHFNILGNRKLVSPLLKASPEPQAPKQAQARGNLFLENEDMLAKTSRKGVNWASILQTEYMFEGRNSHKQCNSSSFPSWTLERDWAALIS